MAWQGMVRLLIQRVPAPYLTEIKAVPLGIL